MADVSYSFPLVSKILPVMADSQRQDLHRKAT